MSLIRGNVQERVDSPKDTSSLIILKIELLLLLPNLFSSVGFHIPVYGTRMMLVLEPETWESPLTLALQSTPPPFSPPPSANSKIWFIYPPLLSPLLPLWFMPPSSHSLISPMASITLLTTLLDSLQSSLQTRITFF